MTTAEINRTITADEFLRVPDNSTMELVDGRLVEKRTSVQSCEVEGLFLYRFWEFLQRNPIATVFSGSLGYRCFRDHPNTIRKPSVTVVLRDRLKKFAGSDPDFMPIVPDLAVEVISPYDYVYDVDERILEYLEAGFPLVLLANPKAKTIRAYPLGGRPVIYCVDDELTADAALPGFRCKVGDFFRDRY